MIKSNGFGHSDPKINKNLVNQLRRKGLSYLDQNNLIESEKCFKESLKYESSNIFSLRNLVEISNQLKKFDQSISYLDKLIRLQPNNEKLYLDLVYIYQKTSNIKMSIIIYTKYLKINPNNDNVYNNLAVLYYRIGDFKKAIQLYRKAININPNFAQAYNNMAAAYADLGDTLKAIELYKNALKINPTYTEAYYNLGNVLRRKGNIVEAITYLSKCLKLNPNHSRAHSELIHSQYQICDWRSFDHIDTWVNDIKSANNFINPMSLLSIKDDPFLHLSIAKFACDSQKITSNHINHSYNNEKIRLGYFSADFCEHPVMQLIIRSLELHNKNEFEIFLYDFAPRNNNDSYSMRIRNISCNYRDISKLSDNEVLLLVYKDNIDIAIDLMGHTKSNRLKLFLNRVAPIQVNYLGYPGSIGSKTHDYILGDKTLLPLENQIHFSEKIAHLPRCYQCLDDTITISSNVISRKDFGLPDNSFIFTSFNSCYKITPNEFDVWMSILMDVPDSYLWIYAPNMITKNNILNEVNRRNISSSRIIFADSLDLSKHLARHKLGNIFLDTFTYSAGITASLALYAGMPIISLLGKSYTSRMSSSLLSALDMNELIAKTTSEYKSIAIRLAKDKDMYITLKLKLQSAIKKTRLFDSKKFTNELENFYKHIKN